MRPPICAICGKDFRASTKEGGLVNFQLTKSEAEFNKRFKNPGFVGHPKGKEWFCGEHYAAAKQLKHLTFSEVKQKLKSEQTSIKRKIKLKNPLTIKPIKEEFKFESKYDFITEKLENRTHFLNNLCSVVSSDIFIIYSNKCFVTITYRNNKILHFEIYTIAEWDYIVLLQERFSNWERNLVSIEKLPFDLYEFDNQLSFVLNKFAEIRNDNSKVLGLPMYDGTFHATYIPLSGYYYFHDSTLPPKILNRLGYFNRKSKLAPVSWKQLVLYAFKEIADGNEVPILPINEVEQEKLSEFTSKIEWLKQKGFYFEMADCFEYSNKKQTNVCIKKEESLYFIEVNNSNTNLIIERFPMVFAIDVLQNIFKNANRVLPSNKTNQWQNLISTDAINSLFQENKNATIAFGPFENSYTNQPDKTIIRKYDSEPKNLLRHLHFIDINDWFLKLETNPI